MKFFQHLTFWDALLAVALTVHVGFDWTLRMEQREINDTQTESLKIQHDTLKNMVTIFAGGACGKSKHWRGVDKRPQSCVDL